MRSLLPSAFVVLCLVINAFAHAAEDKAAAPSAADADRLARSEEKRVLQALSKPIAFECEDRSIDEAVARISQLIDSEILIDELRLREEGISTENTTFTLKIGNLTGWQVLHFMLHPHQLDWVANDGVLEITTKTHADEVLVTRVYDVHKLCKLLEPISRELLNRPLRPKQPPPGMMGGGGGGGGGFFSVPSTQIANGAIGQMGMAMGVPAPVMPVFTSVEGLLAAMIQYCTTLQWMDRDGEGGSIQLGQGCLIISQSYQGHFLIAGLLDALEQLVDGKVKGKSIAAHRTGYPVEEDARIFEALAKPVNIDIEPETLDQVVRKILQDAGLRVWIDTVSLADEGVSLDESVGPRRKMRRVPLAVCLKKILDQSQLTFVVEEGVVVVTTKTRAQEMMSVRFYDISGISKILNEDPNTRIVTVLSRSVHGTWQDMDGEGGAAALVSTKHLAVLQTQQVHSEISLLIDDLSKEELLAPSEPAMELRAYTATNAETARDLERLIPQMLQSKWLARGSIRRAGESLLITQPVAVHDQIDEVMDKLEQSYAKKHPKKDVPQENNDEPKKQ